MIKVMNRVSLYNGLGPEEKESFLLSLNITGSIDLKFTSKLFFLHDSPLTAADCIIVMSIKL